MPPLFWKVRQKALLNLEFKTSLNNLTSLSSGGGRAKNVLKTKLHLNCFCCGCKDEEKPRLSQANGIVIGASYVQWWWMPESQQRSVQTFPELLAVCILRAQSSRQHSVGRESMWTGATNLPLGNFFCFVNHIKCIYIQAAALWYIALKEYCCTCGPLLIKMLCAVWPLPQNSLLSAIVVCVGHAPPSVVLWYVFRAESDDIFVL